MDNFWELSIGFIFVAFAALSILGFAPDTEGGEDSSVYRIVTSITGLSFQKINDEDNG